MLRELFSERGPDRKAEKDARDRIMDEFERRNPPSTVLNPDARRAEEEVRNNKRVKLMTHLTRSFDQGIIPADEKAFITQVEAELEEEEKST